MSESRFLSLMTKARLFSSRGERFDYWHGYQRGLRRGFQGDLFGTEAEHELWMRLADEGPDNESRERGRGYRDGLSAYSAAVAIDELAGPPANRGTPPKGTKDRRHPSRR